MWCGFEDLINVDITMHVFKKFHSKKVILKLCSKIIKITVRKCFLVIGFRNLKEIFIFIVGDPSEIRMTFLQAFLYHLITKKKRRYP